MVWFPQPGVNYGTSHSICIGLVVHLLFFCGMWLGHCDTRKLVTVISTDINSTWRLIAVPRLFLPLPGKGTQTWKKTGAIYSGDWKYGKRDGYGTYSLPDPVTKEYKKVYAGWWKNDKQSVSCALLWRLNPLPLFEDPFLTPFWFILLLSLFYCCIVVYKTLKVVSLSVYYCYIRWLAWK